MSCLRLRCMLSIISLLSFEEGTLDDQLSDRLVTLVHNLHIIHFPLHFIPVNLKVLQNHFLVFLISPATACDED
jgi:hypothetical protein